MSKEAESRQEQCSTELGRQLKAYFPKFGISVHSKAENFPLESCSDFVLASIGRFLILGDHIATLNSVHPICFKSCLSGHMVANVYKGILLS